MMTETNNNHPAGNYEQQISHLQQANDKLLHKYIAAVTDEKWSRALTSCILLLICFVPLGILGIIELHLKWSVVIAFWAWAVLAVVCELAYTYPLSKSRIAITPADKLRPTLLRFASFDRIVTTILLVLFVVLFIWVAFEVREALGFRILGYDLKEDITVPVFWFIIVLGVTCVISSILSTIQNTHDINKLVADIDELS